MGKISYYVCDVCGKSLRDDPRMFVDAKHIYIGFMNCLDICDACCEKLSKIKIDKKIEEQIADELIANNDKYTGSVDEQAAYYQGICDTLNQLLIHNRIARIKI